MNSDDRTSPVLFKFFLLSTQGSEFSENQLCDKTYKMQFIENTLNLKEICEDAETTVH